MLYFDTSSNFLKMALLAICFKPHRKNINLFLKISLKTSGERKTHFPLNSVYFTEKRGSGVLELFDSVLILNTIASFKLH